jgi:hypothetical protein
VTAWVDSSDVAAALGGVTANDEEYLDRCTAAANEWAFRRRHQAGYRDDSNTSPGPDASMGVTMYAVALFRERGSVDSFASFEEFSTGVLPQATFGQVLRLLGIPKPAVDRPWTTDELIAAGYRGIR